MRRLLLWIALFACGIAAVPAPSTTNLLAANAGNKSISVNKVAPDGSLSQVPGSPFKTANRPFELLLMGDYLLVVNGGAGDNSLSSFRYDRVSGLLTLVQNVSLGTTVDQPLSAINTDTRTFVVVQGTDGIAKSFDLNPDNGTLTMNDSAPVSGTAINDTSIYRGSPSYFLTNNTGTNNVSVYTLDPAAGTLTEVPGSPFANPQAGDVPAGLFCAREDVYVTNSVHNSISHFRLDPATGSLTPKQVIPSGGLGPWGMNIQDAPKTLFVCNSGSHNLSAFDVGPEGALSPTAGYPVPAGGKEPHEFSILKLENGKTMLYVSTADSVSGFELDVPTRHLTPLPTSPFPGFFSPNALAH